MTWREVAGGMLTAIALLTALSAWFLLPHRVMAVETDILSMKTTILTNADRVHKMEVDVSTALAVLVEQSKNQAEQTRRMQADITEIKNRSK